MAEVVNMYQKLGFGGNNNKHFIHYVSKFRLSPVPIIKKKHEKVRPS